MVSSTITFSGLLCLVLSLNPATVLSAPQIPTDLPFPDLINHGPETTTDAAGNTDTKAGSGVNVAIPGGPYVNAGVGFHDSHRGPCGPTSGNDHLAGAGVNVGMPGGPTINVGTGKHSHEDGYPCPEPPVAIVSTTQQPASVPTIILPPTFVTPISIPTTTAPVYVPAVPVVPTSTPLIHAAPTATPSPSYAPVSPVFNAGSALAPGSLVVVVVPVIMAFFH
ncbi:hypothetical protein N7535_002960 [Penicillium sp. DV-2018c]|nr:hypothetical protein N7535_002960 [Penicillium sp. DV-2018c]